MDSDDSPGEPEPDGNSDHARDRTNGETPVDSVDPDEETPVDSAGPGEEVSVQDQWHGDPPEGWDKEKDGGVFGAGPEEDEYEPPPIEPGDPSLENALFVLLGVLTSVGLLIHVVVSF